MVYRENVTLPLELGTALPGDEMVFRQVMHRMVEGIPLDELKKVFSMALLNPVSTEGLEAMADPFSPGWLREKLRLLAASNVKMYSVEIEIE